MTVELANYLIDLDKFIIQDGQSLEKFNLIIYQPMNFRLQLSAPDDLDQILMIDVNESDKKS